MAGLFINEIIRRLSPWYRLEFRNLETDYVFVRLLGEDMQVAKLNDRFLVRSVSPNLLMYEEKTYNAHRIEKILNGWVRNDAGDLVHPDNEAQSCPEI